LWTVDGGVGFGDLIISDDPAAVERYNSRRSVQPEKVSGERMSNVPPAHDIREGYRRKPVETGTIVVTVLLLSGPVALWLCTRRRKQESSSA
jgi:hypothetical protein